ncbi:transposon Ty3-I Gag-Pol polyprotein, partial [Trichonephila clavipes]
MESCGYQSFPKHLRADILRHFHDAPPQDTLVFAKTYDRIRKNFTGRECTEMSFDRGAVFRSRLVSSLVDLCNIDHRFTTAYHPQTNGLTERFNKTLADMLSMYVDVEQKNWDEILPFVTFAYNTAKQETTAARAEESRQLARVHTLRKAQDKDRRRYDSKHQMVSYAPGDLVWIYTPVRKVGLSEKLLRVGPYRNCYAVY